jgi:hypothetical protein
LNSGFAQWSTPSTSPTDVKAALEFSRKATELNLRSDFAHLVYGLILLYVKRDLDAAARRAS